MRKFNAILSMAIVAMFLVHGVAGGLQLFGLMAGGDSFLTYISWALLVLIGIHIIIGVKLTADSLKAIRLSGTSYFGPNKLFWARRISGFAAMLFIAIHVIIFMGRSEPYRLNLFEGIQLASQILMVIALAIHLTSNIRPSMVSLGRRELRPYAADILVVLSVIMLFTAMAFAGYYIRWNVL